MQLSVDVTSNVPGQVLFTFRNRGLKDSSITDIYFDDGSLFGIHAIDNSDPGVSFTQPATPPNLPGGNEISQCNPFIFETTETSTEVFSADSKPPVEDNGVNPGESVGILFDLISGMTFVDVLNQLRSGIELRIGIHVQGFVGGGSESFVTLSGPRCGDGIVESPEVCENNTDCPDGKKCLLNCICLPTVSGWGMIMLVLFLLTGIATKFRRWLPL